MTIPAPYPQTTGNEPCATGNPERFFPDQGNNGRVVESAKAECRACPILDGCLAYALSHKVAGVWAATTPEDRDRERKARGIKAEPLRFGGLVAPNAPVTPVEHGGWQGIAYHRKRYELNCDACRAFATENRRKSERKRAEAATAS